MGPAPARSFEHAARDVDDARSSVTTVDRDDGGEHLLHAEHLGGFDALSCRLAHEVFWRAKTRTEDTC
jgi:hypothetical protein